MSLKKPMTATWNSEPPNEWFLWVEIEDEGHFNGSLTRDEGLLLLHTAGLDTTGEIMRHTATRIMMGTFALAKAYGATYSLAAVDSPYAMKIRQNIFGPHMTITDLYAESPDQSMTASEAMEALEEHRKKFSGDESSGIIVCSDLTGIDTSMFEMPIELNKPEGLQLR